MFNLKIFNRLLSTSRLGEGLSIASRRAISTQQDSQTEQQIPDRREKTVNTVTLLGRTGTDPQKKGSGEHPLVVFSLATHTSYRYETGESVEKTDWHRVIVFKPALREMVFNYLRKGQRVLVSGKISYGSVSENSTLKPTTSIIADDVIFFYQSDSES